MWPPYLGILLWFGSWTQIARLEWSVLIPPYIWRQGPLLFWSEQRVWVDIDGQSVGRWCSNVSIRQRDMGDVENDITHTHVPEGTDKPEISSITNRRVMQPIWEPLAFPQTNHASSGGLTLHTAERNKNVCTHAHTRVHMYSHTYASPCASVPGSVDHTSPKWKQPVSISYWRDELDEARADSGSALTTERMEWNADEQCHVEAR